MENPSLFEHKTFLEVAISQFSSPLISGAREDGGPESVKCSDLRDSDLC